MTTVFTVLGTFTLEQKNGGVLRRRYCVFIGVFRRGKLADESFVRLVLVDLLIFWPMATNPSLSFVFVGSIHEIFTEILRFSLGYP